MHTDIDWTNPPALRLGALGLLLNDEGRVLLVEKRYKTGPERFGLPGGCAHGGEDARAACRREVREELGLDVAPGDVLNAHYMPPADTAPGQNFVFNCGTIPSAAQMTLGDEISGIRWTDPSELRHVTAPYTAARVSAALVALNGGPVQYLVGHPAPA